VQPIKTQQGDFLFDDKDILEAMEEYHIHKGIQPSQQSTTLMEEIDAMINSTQDQPEDLEILNSDITLQEVKSTFETSSGSPGPDGFSGKLLDEADRDEVALALHHIFQKAWGEGTFAKIWKQEHRPLIPKAGKDSHHDRSSYRTISLTAIMGKRFEKITSKRLICHLMQRKFDKWQFAYLEGRSTTQALLLLLERIAAAMKDGKKVGVAFF